jgi:hypothetical protein
MYGYAVTSNYDVPMFFTISLLKKVEQITGLKYTANEVKKI